MPYLGKLAFFLSLASLILALVGWSHLRTGRRLSIIISAAIVLMTLQAVVTLSGPVDTLLGLTGVVLIVFALFTQPSVT
jgi:hypothetical protein